MRRLRSSEGIYKRPHSLHQRLFRWTLRGWGGLKQLYFVSGFKFFRVQNLGVLFFSWTSFIAKKVCEYKNGCSYLATHNCHMCSTFHCDLHVSRHFDESRKIDLRKNELQLWANLAYTMLLKDNVTYLLLCFVVFAKWRFHSSSHDCIGTHRSHENPKKHEEFQYQHCLIWFKEYSGTKRHADFAHTLHLFESKINKKKKLKKTKKIIPTCIPCERRVEKEFGTIPDYIPVIQSRLHDDGDDDKATDAHDQDLIMMKDFCC